ncbi:MAG: LysE family translocator [Robiginitomaculum sp.]|nr:LysE family translocator [Robiginitomaculum sp.]
MTYQYITALIMFAFVSSITPGPNNLMLMASGANFGFKRSLPHMLGISIGFCFMVTLVGIGLIRIFDLYPVSYTIMKIFSVGYMLFLAYKIANSAPPKDAQKTGKPFTFLQAAAFQWVNPKAWAMALGAITLFASSQEFSAIILVTAAFGLVNFPAITLWTILGQQMRRWLNSSTKLRAFNYTMAALLIASLYPVLL